MANSVKDRTIIFAGPPSQLEGAIPVTNRSADKLRLKTVPLGGTNLLGPARAPLTELRLGVRVAAGQQANVPSVLELDPHTPPGVYDLTAEVAGESVALQAHVVEVVDFRIEPQSVTLLVGEKRVIERQFVVENAGNVPLPLGERCEAPLFDSVDLISAMLVGLKRTKSAKAQDRVEGWLEEWSKKYVGNLVLTREPFTLKPGQKVARTAKFHLPEDLPASRHLQTTLQLYNAVVTVDVYTTGKATARDNQPR